MRLSLSDAYNNPTKDLILNNISEEQIWRRYCTNFKHIGKGFLSDLYKDTTPSCYIFYKDGKLVYKDFGTGHNLDTFQYIMLKFNVDFPEAVRIIAQDFNLSVLSPLNTNKVQLPQNNENLVKSNNIKSEISIVKQGYTITDKEYWGQYEIPLELLFKNQVYSCSKFVIKKQDVSYTFEYKVNNPIYGYVFNYDGEEYYKIYRPLNTGKGKWFFTGNFRCVEGYSMLPETGKLLILTKSLKDCMCYSLMGISAISLPSEHTLVREKLITKLSSRFNKIIINYDSDQSGYTASKKISEQYGLERFFIPDEKDLSDYIKKNGLAQAKKIIYEKIENWL